MANEIMTPAKRERIYGLVEKLEIKLVNAEAENAKLTATNRALAEKVCELEEQLNKFRWRSVEDEPPEIEAALLVCVPLAVGEYINIAIADCEGDLMDVDGGYIGHHASQVSRWMPLPDAPEN